MSERIEKIMVRVMGGKKNVFSYLIYGILFIFFAMGVFLKFLLTSLVLNKKRLQ